MTPLTQMRTTKYSKIDEFFRFVCRFALHMVSFFYLRQMRKYKHHGNNNQQCCQYDIRQLHGVSFRLNVAFPIHLT